MFFLTLPSGIFIFPRPSVRKQKTLFSLDMFKIQTHFGGP